MRRILVALDGSARAREVLDAAARLAALANAKLVLFRAIAAAPEQTRNSLIAADARLEDVLRANAHADLALSAAHLSPGLVEHIVVELATAWDGICRMAREREVDLIVIGSHGYGGIERIVGTTAAKVVNHADRNVLVVRTPLWSPTSILA